MLVDKQLKSLNGHSVLVLRFIILEDEDNKRVKIIYETIRESRVKTYILFKKQAEALMKIDINPLECNCHHLAQKTLKDKFNGKLRKANKKSRMGLMELGKKINFDLVVFLPIDIHEKYNRIFKGCLIPRMVLDKLDKILKSKNLNGAYKNDVIDFFTFIAILENDILNIDMDEICKLKKANEEICTATLLSILGITGGNMHKYIMDIFLYPRHKEKSWHFNTLLDIHNEE